MVIVITGPTGVGKTKLSIELAKKYNGEIINADAVQVYKGLDIGSAKITKEEMEGIPHHLFDIKDVNEEYTIYHYQEDCRKVINIILSKGKTPILVGGTGLYVNSLIYSIEYNEMDFDENYRKKLMDLAEKEEGLNKLYLQAKKIDQKAMEKISPNDKKRIIRVLEIYNQTGKTKTQQEIESRKNDVKYDYKIYGLNTDRDFLYKKINKRVDIMIEKGLIEEVQDIIKKHNKFPTAMQAIGYKEIVEYLQNKITKEEAIEKIKQETRRYAKRQITWFKRIDNIKWLDCKENLQTNLKLILEDTKWEK